MAQNYKIPHRLKTNVAKKLQKPTILMNFVHFMHKNLLVPKKKTPLPTKKWLNSDRIGILFVFLQ